MKFNNQLKEKLEKRRIAPTASAWDRIEGKLDVAQGKKKGKQLLWVGIAASFIAGICITAAVYNNNLLNTTPVIVQTPASEQIEILQESVINNTPKSSVELAQTTTRDALSTKREASATVASQKEKKQLISTPSQEAAVATVVVPQVILKSVKSNAVKVFNEEVIVLTPKNSQNYPSKLNTAIVTNQEVNALLANAQQEIVIDNLTSSKINKMVDANELLLEVEAEVDPDSFKDRVYRTLKKEVNRAIQAVASKDH